MVIGNVKARSFGDSERTKRNDHSIPARLWNLTAANPGAAPIVLRTNDSLAFCLAMSPDNRWLVTGSRDKTARLWDLTAKDPGATSIALRGHQDTVECVAFTPDSRCVVTGGRKRGVYIWPLRLDELLDLARRTAGRELTDEEQSVYMLPHSSGEPPEGQKAGVSPDRTNRPPERR